MYVVYCFKMVKKNWPNNPSYIYNTPHMYHTCNDTPWIRKWYYAEQYLFIMKVYVSTVVNIR